MNLKVRKLQPDAVMPAYAFPGDAGADLSVVEGGKLLPGEARDFPVGLAVEPPLGYWFLIHGRSSTLRKRGLFVNPGIIDNGYRGPLFVYVRNDNGGFFGRLLAAIPGLRRLAPTVEIVAGDRLAQMILLPYAQPVIHEVAELGDSHRGESGFGSTGLNIFIPMEQASAEIHV